MNTPGNVREPSPSTSTGASNDSRCAAVVVPADPDVQDSEGGGVLAGRAGSEVAREEDEPRAGPEDGEALGQAVRQRGSRAPIRRGAGDIVVVSPPGRNSASRSSRSLARRTGTSERFRDDAAQRPQVFRDVSLEREDPDLHPAAPQLLEDRLRPVEPDRVLRDQAGDDPLDLVRDAPRRWPRGSGRATPCGPAGSPRSRAPGGRRSSGRGQPRPAPRRVPGPT